MNLFTIKSSAIRFLKKFIFDFTSCQKQRTKKLHFWIFTSCQRQRLRNFILIFYFLPKAKIFWFLFISSIIFWFLIFFNHHGILNFDFRFSCSIIQWNFNFGFWFFFLFNRHSSMKYITSLLKRTKKLHFWSFTSCQRQRRRNFVFDILLSA